MKYILLGLLFTGCATTQYNWTSEEGRQCFYKCGQDYYKCEAYCNGNYACYESCSNSTTYCYAACPDLYVVQ